MPPRKTKSAAGHSQVPVTESAPGTVAPHSPDKAGQIIRVGPAGWSYPDWAGYVYPPRRPKGFHEATYLAEFFDTIEINTSFYQPLRPDHATQWIDRVAANPRFVFTAKLWQRFTHVVADDVTHGPVSALPSATAEDERAVRAGFDPLHKAGKL